MQSTSLSLLQRLGDDPEDADWKRLVDIYRPFVFQRVSTYPLLVGQAEDIVQEVLMVLMRELPVFQRQREGSFRAWFRQIVLNQLRYAVRRTQKAPIPVEQNEKLNYAIEQLADPQSQESDDFDREHDKAVFRHASEQVRSEIKESTWQAFQRHVIKGENAQSVADSLGVSLNVVLLAKSRVTRRIREEVEGMID